MKWSIDKECEPESYFLTINGERANMRDGRPNRIEMAGLGNKKSEIWFKIKDDGGRRLDRSDFEENGSELTEKLKFCKSNGEFVEVLASFGIAIKSRDRRAAKTKSRGGDVPPDHVLNHELSETLPSAIRSKCTERKRLDIEFLMPAPVEMRIRPLNRSWISEIKSRLSTSTVTSIPVLQDTESECYFTIGGNHLVTAIKEAVDEDPQTYQSLRSINCDIYTDISATEARMIAAAHNNMTEVRSLLFQDRVHVARQCFVYEDPLNWKSTAAETLSLLDGQKIERKNLSLVFFVASFNEDTWTKAENIFKEYEYISPRCSFPQQLFRQLQSIGNDAQLNKYLEMAKGTSGVKMARQIAINKQRDNAKELACMMYGVLSWDEVVSKLGVARCEKIKKYNGTLSSQEGRQKYKAFLSRLETEEDSTEDNEISIKLLRNGVDISEDYNDLLKKHANLIKMEIEKEE